MPQHHDGESVDAVKFIEQVDRSSEFDFKGLDGLLTVHTRNSIYQFDLGAGLVRGGVVGDDWVPGRPEGTTFGGSMIMVGRLVEGAHMEFVANGQVFTTSWIQKVSYRERKDM